MLSQPPTNVIPAFIAGIQRGIAASTEFGGGLVWPPVMNTGVTSVDEEGL